MIGYRSFYPLFSLLAALTLSGGIQAAPHDYDPDNGEEINEVCAGCHGEFGQGGKEGEYPRLAGMPAEFISRQLLLFRDRKRPNLAMVEYVDHRQMPDPDIWDVSIYLSKVQLKTKLPPADETDPDFDAYQRLLDSKQLMQIPRATGDIEAGRRMYRKECGSCHGKEGWGNQEDATPMLAGQYTNYLWRQVKKYREGIRIHDPEDPEDTLLTEFEDSELRDIFAYLSIVDD
ncbi:MAG: c-type cytochrome [Gammaproteobacteria bacterium]|nr:c-type cytochrome [Gammaproteobacteria bacterium]